MKLYEEYPYLMDPEWLEAYDFATSLTRRDPEAPIAELDCAVAILLTEGVPSDMAKLLGRSRSQVVSRIANDAHLTELAEEVTETLLDDVEKLQMAAARAGDLQSQRFILTTLGKKRGYVTRQEQEVKQKTSVTITGTDAEL